MKLEHLPLKNVLQIIEVDTAEYLAGDLFKRRFNTDSFPQEPRHFVALSKLSDESFLTMGYVHYHVDNDAALCGGLVIDNRNYRKLPKEYRNTIKASGGIAELLLTHSFDLLPSSVEGIWGYVGDKQSKKVCLRVGFEKTYHQYILVVWRNKMLNDYEKEVKIKRIEDMGPF